VFVPTKQVFDVIPASGSGFTILLIVLSLLVVVLAGVVVLFGSMSWSSRHTSVEISSEGVKINGGVYGRKIPLGELIADQASVVDLETDTGLKLSRRTNGIGMPGYSAGWFKTKNGTKVLAFVTDRKRVVYLPTRQNYSVLLSVESPEAVVNAVRAAGGH
jgi:hypothetical protein